MSHSHVWLWGLAVAGATGVALWLPLNFDAPVSNSQLDGSEVRPRGVDQSFERARLAPKFHENPGLPDTVSRVNAGVQEQFLGACSGGWGFVDNPNSAVHVRVDGDDSAGDGSIASPVASIERALDIAGAGGTVAVGPGVFPTSAVVDQSLDGVAIQGCGPEQTTLSAPNDGDSILEFKSGSFELAGVSVDGGTDPLTVSATAFLEADTVEVRNARGTGVYAGQNTRLTLIDTVVADTIAGDGCGWGVHAEKSLLQVYGGRVTGAHEVGIFIDRGDFSIDGIEVDHTASRDDGTLGRGIHVEDAIGTLSNASFHDNQDASVFLRKPKSVIVGSIIIDITGAGILPDGDYSGDGLVVYGGKGGKFYSKVAYTMVKGSDRAGILVEDAQVELTSNKGADNGTMATMGADMFIQGDDVSVSGNDAMNVYDMGSEGMSIKKDKLKCTP